MAVAGLTLLLVAGLAGSTLQAKPKGKGKGKGTPADLVPQFDTRTLASGFEKAISFDFLPNGKILVAEKGGRLYIVDTSGDVNLLLDISANVVTDRERGLEGIEVDSNFAANRRVYLLYGFKANPLRPTGPQALRLSYITLTANDTVANPGAPETVILGKDASEGSCAPVHNRRDCPASIDATHQGGTVLSAPDGTLFVGFGDSNLPDSPGAQVFRTYNPASTSGKLLHIDQNGNGLRNHPFCKKDRNLTHTCTKIFARGFRNPFRFTLTPGGDPIVADVGWNEREEIDLVKKGANYGWPCMEGNVKTPFYRELRRCQNLYKKRRPFAKPLFEYPNNRKLGGAAAIMGPFYDSGVYPDSLDETFFFGDYASRFIKEAVLRKGKFKGIRTVATEVFPVQFRRAPSGNIAYVDFVMGAVQELVFSPGNKGPRAEIAATPTSGAAPLGVALSGTLSKDPEGGPLTYEWDFGDGSPLSNEAAPLHTYTAEGNYTAKLKVTDVLGASDRDTVKIFAGNSAPSAALVAPKSGTLSRGGTPIVLQASGFDAEDGALPPGAFSWDVILVHKGHRHTLGSVTGNPAQFQAVTDHDADSYYEVNTKVTDSDGLAVELPTFTIGPETVKLEIKSDLRGVPLSYGGRVVGSSKTLTAAVGFHANLSAPERVNKGGRSFRFARWSQGGPRVQIFEVPDRKSEIRAIYKASKGR